MRHQQVVPDYVVMLESSITVLALVGCGWILIKLVSACIWFPQYMQNLEVEAAKANAHLQAKLLPKGDFNDDDDGTEEQTNGGGDEKKEPLCNVPEAETEETTAEEPKKDK